MVVRADHFVASVEFWKYIVVLVAMVVVTFGLVTAVQALSERSYKRKLKELELAIRAGIDRDFGA